MPRYTRRAVFALAVAPAGVGAQSPAWPGRPVRLILPSAPGGNPDIVARLFAQRLADRTKQSFLVENKAGAAGIVGADAAMSAPPDGNTLMFGFNQLATLNALLYRKLPYDPAAMTPLARLTRTSFVMLVPKDLPAATAEEFFALARRQPGVMVHGTSGPGSISHLTNELLRRDLGVDLLHVPYRTTAVAELISGQVSLLVEPAALAVSLTRGPDAKVRALAQLGPEPDPALPGVPVLSQSYPGFVITGWHAIWGPPGLPAPLAEQITSVLLGLSNDAWLAERLAALATYLNVTDADGLRRSIAEDMTQWAGIIRDKGIILD
jgi:tripartite-type tricarboxylate transporter receptor subunit TctC